MIQIVTIKTTSGNNAHYIYKILKISSLNGYLTFKLDNQKIIRKTIMASIDVLEFRTLVPCQKDLDKMHRPRSDCF